MEKIKVKNVPHLPCRPQAHPGMDTPATLKNIRTHRE